MRAITVAPGVAILSALGDVLKPRTADILSENNVVFGSVRVNRAPSEIAAQSLAHVPLDRWREAYVRRPDDVKVIVDLEAAA